MEKEKFPVPGGHSARYASFSSQSKSFHLKLDSSPSSALQNVRHFSHDIKQMPENPPRNAGHRRAQSEILSLPDDITFDSELGVVGSGDGEGPPLFDETEEDLLSMYFDMDDFVPSSPPSGSGFGPPPSGMEKLDGRSNERPRVRHQHSQSMDGSSSVNPELLGSSSEGPSLAETKTALSAAKLADHALIDPKRAKRIWANRQSAARSKERKMRYIAELERKVQSLRTEATTLNAQLSMLQRDTTGLTSENSGLKLRLQTMEQQVNLQDALNDSLREEVQQLKVATGQAISNGGQTGLGSSSFSTNQKLYHKNQSVQSLLTAHHLQQLQIHSQPQQKQFHLQALQPSSDQKLKGSTISPTQRDGTSNNNSAPKG